VALADKLRAAGFSGSGTILADSFHTGGNMRIAFPDARIIDVGYPPSIWPAPRGDGQCLLVWNAHKTEAENEDARQYVLSYLPKLAGAADAPHREGVASALMYGSDKREYRLGFRLYEEPLGDCR
jgi:hypothetical protein